MDTTYFGRSFGVMVLMDSISGQVLSVREVKHETNALYAEALNDLREKGIAIQSIVCDGRKGLLQLLSDTQPENGSGQGVVAAGANAERQQQGGLPKRPASVV